MSSRFLHLPPLRVAFCEVRTPCEITVKPVFDIHVLNCYLHAFLVNEQDAFARNAVHREFFKKAFCERITEIVAEAITAPHYAGETAPFDLSRCMTTARFRSAFAEPGENPALSYQLPSGLAQVLPELSNHQVAALHLAASKYAKVAA